jgi:hypothetical protein
MLKRTFSCTRRTGSFSPWHLRRRRGSIPVGDRRGRSTRPRRCCGEPPLACATGRPEGCTRYRARADAATHGPLRHRYHFANILHEEARLLGHCVHNDRKRSRACCAHSRSRPRPSAHTPTPAPHPVALRHGSRVQLPTPEELPLFLLACSGALLSLNQERPDCARVGISLVGEG